MSKRITLDDRELELANLVFEYTRSRLESVSDLGPTATFAISWTQLEVSRLAGKFKEASQKEEAPGA